MSRLLLATGALLLIVAALAPAAAWYIERNMTRDVILITPDAPEVVVVQKGMWMKGEPVADIYGKPVDKKIRVVRPDPRDIIVPEEDPSLTLMVSNSPRHPLQVQTVWVAVKYGSPAAACAGAILVAMALWWKRRRNLKVAAGAA
jgi:hypothetical protein